MTRRAHERRFWGLLRLGVAGLVLSSVPRAAAAREAPAADPFAGPSSETSAAAPPATADSEPSGDTETAPAKPAPPQPARTEPVEPAEPASAQPAPAQPASGETAAVEKAPLDKEPRRDDDESADPGTQRFLIPVVQAGGGFAGIGNIAAGEFHAASGPALFYDRGQRAPITLRFPMGYLGRFGLPGRDGTRRTASHFVRVGFLSSFLMSKAPLLSLQVGVEGHVGLHDRAIGVTGRGVFGLAVLLEVLTLHGFVEGNIMAGGSSVGLGGVAMLDATVVIHVLRSDDDD